MDPKKDSNLIRRISRKEKIPFSKEDHRTMDREMAGATDDTIKKFSSS